MVKKRNIIKLIIILFLSILLSILLLKLNLFDIKTFQELGNDFQYNAITVSATIAGFLFTGISLLISTIGYDHIKRLWDNNYLDNLYRAGFIGIAANIITIILAVIVLYANIEEKIEYYMINIQYLSMVLSFVFFIWCLKKIIRIQNII